VYRLAVGEFTLEGRKSQENDSFLNLVPSDEHASLQKKVLDSAKQPLRAFLVFGWTGVEEGMCAAAIERSRKVIPMVASAVCAVITSIGKKRPPYPLTNIVSKCKMHIDA
jgi:fructose-specific phosphotransferase system IIC component